MLLVTITSTRASDMAFDILHKKLTVLGDKLKKDLTTELLLQKHKASGKLINSIDMEVKQTVDRISLTESHLFYGDFVDRGRPAGLGASTRNGNFQLALERWVRIKGFATEDKEVRNIAFLIRRKIFREGIPTRRSRSLAPRRLNWLTGTVEQNNDLIEQTLEEALILEFDVIIDNILATTNAKIKAQG